MKRTQSSLVTASRHVREAVARRDALIRRARTEGYSLREIGALAGLSHQGVKLICEAGPGEDERL